MTNPFIYNHDATCKDQQVKVQSVRVCLTLFKENLPNGRNTKHKSDICLQKCPRQSGSMFLSKLEFPSHKSDIYLQKCPRQSGSMFLSKLEFPSHKSDIYLQKCPRQSGSMFLSKLKFPSHSSVYQRKNLDETEKLFQTEFPTCL